MKKLISFEYRITLTYIVLGVLWILFSDELVVSMTSDPRQIQLLSTYKGWLFVMVTGVLLFLLVRREIKRRSVIYNQLLEAKKRAEESDKLKTAFLSNLSHYIRSPMNSILGFVELLEDKDTTPENHHLFLSYVNERSQHLLQTLTSIVEIAKIQQGQAEVNLKPFKINALMNAIIATANLDLTTHHKPLVIKTSYALSDGQDVITSDKDKVFQILSHLVTNAIHFTAQGTIEIGYSVEGNIVLFRVKDTGLGIDPDNQASLFSEFMYHSSYTCSLSEGAGLGLHLSFGLAKLLGGNLWLERSDSTGSTFCLSVPYSCTQHSNHLPPTLNAKLIKRQPDEMVNMSSASCFKP